MSILLVLYKSFKGINNSLIITSIKVLESQQYIKEDNDYGVNINLFYKQMLLMKKMGYESINLNQIENVSSNKTFVITFDDGYENVYTYAMPILKKLNFTATCF